MKKLTLQVLTLTIAIIAFSATDAIAQKRINLDKNGKAKISSMIESMKLSDIKYTWSISGKQFSSFQVKQTNSGKFKYRTCLSSILCTRQNSRSLPLDSQRTVRAARAGCTENTRENTHRIR
jgi:hypothetical protein